MKQILLYKQNEKNEKKIDQEKMTVVFNVVVKHGTLKTLDFYYTISNPFSHRF